jgi:hypothetical protein
MHSTTVNQKKKNFNQQQKATPKTLIQTNKNKMGKLK